jgi:arabinan endo-1,5-alpha-L-arabinosidase
MYEGETYWRFTTSGNIAVATAPFLEGPWTYRGALLHNGTSINLHANQDIWVHEFSPQNYITDTVAKNCQAPTVMKRDETFYCHYSVSFFGSQRSEICVATSKSLEPGSWTDHGTIGLPQSIHYNLIDPYVFQERLDGPSYFTFGSYWTGIQQLQLDSHQQLLSWSGNQEEIKNIISNTTREFAVQEGAIMYQHEECYYIFFSVGQCCRTEGKLVPSGDEYHVAVCRAYKITGPYHDADGKDCLTESGGTTILASHGDVYAPGGQGVMVDPKSEKTVMYYHYGE